MNPQLLEQLQQAYRDFDLFPLTDREKTEKFRVNFGLEVLARMKQEIAASPKNGKFVFTGHTGCGKSTLLKRLSDELIPDQYPVFFSIADLIEMSDVTHTNILYSIALLLLAHARKLNVNVSPDIIETIEGWHIKTHTQITEQETSDKISLEADLKWVTTQLQQEKSFRDEIEEKFEKNISDLVTRIDRLAAGILIKTKRPVLVIIDDLDKIDLPIVEEIYRNNIKALFSPQIRIVFTIPIAAVQEPAVMGALNSQGIVRPHLFPVAKFFGKGQRTEKPKTTPIEIFLEALYKRLPAELIDPATAEKIVLQSGGLIRELVRLGRECCLESMLQMDMQPDRPLETIDEEILKRAVKNIRNDFARQLGSKRYELLVQVYKSNEPLDSKDADFINLLHGLMILEYENDDLWYDVHPIVVELLKLRKLLP